MAGWLISLAEKEMDECISVGKCKFHRKKQKKIMPLVNCVDSMNFLLNSSGGRRIISKIIPVNWRILDVYWEEEVKSEGG